MGTGLGSATGTRGCDYAALGARAHGSKFPDAEALAIAAHSRLAEEDGSTIVENDPQRQPGEDRRQTEQPNRGARRIEESHESLPNGVHGSAPNPSPSPIARWRTRPSNV